MKKPLNDRISDLKAAKLKMAARLSALEGKAKQAERKQDTRRKVVIGGAVLLEMERSPAFAKHMSVVLDRAITRDQDRLAIAPFLRALAPSDEDNAAGEGEAPQRADTSR